MTVTPDSISVIEIPISTNVFDVLTTQTLTIELGPLGPQGPSGPQGSTANVFYTHVQATPSAVWTIAHNLNGYPTAVVLDSAGTQCEGSFNYTDTNTMVITFTAAFSGNAYVI